MRDTKRRFCKCLGSAGVVLAALCMASTPAVAQENTHAAQSGGKASIPIVGALTR